MDCKKDHIRIKDMLADDRPREKMKRLGSEALSEVELMAILVGAGTSKESALSIAGRILHRMSQDGKFMDTTLEELLEVHGVGLSTASKVVAAMELSKRFSARDALAEVKISAPATIANLFMEELKNEQKEYFYILLLDTKGKLISKELISVGDLNSSIVHPREVFSKAIRRSAYAIALIHNHPSGDPAPSKEDINITKRLKEAGDLLGIQVLDHIIIGYNSYRSLKQEEIF